MAGEPHAPRRPGWPGPEGSRAPRRPPGTEGREVRDHLASCSLAQDTRCIHGVSGKVSLSPGDEAGSEQVPASTEPAFECRRGTAYAAGTGRDGKQTEDRGSPRSPRERLTFELLELAGPLIGRVTRRQCLHLPAPVCGPDNEQETVVARGGGRARATEPPASHLPLHSTLLPRFCCCCSPGSLP